MAKRSVTQRTEIRRQYYSDGSVKMVYHVRGRKRQGLCTVYFKNGKLWAHGNFKDNEFTGRWRWNRATGGPLQVGSFVAGRQDGLWKRFYRTGQLWDIGLWRRGKRVGLWKIYNRNGTLNKIRKYSSPTV